MHRIIVRTLPVLACAALGFACAEKKAPDAPAAAKKAEPAKAEPAKAEAPASQPAKAAEPAAIPRSKSLEGAKVFFKSPAEGAKVKSPVKLEFGIEGMKIAKAGDNTPGTGHHHLIIDADLPKDMGMPIPADKNYIHYGTGATSAEVELAPGEHKLRLLLGNYIHVPHDPPVASEVLTITVVE